MIASILVVDDDPAILSLLKSFLEERHHRVLTATDGAQAFATAEKERPHLIIMDVVMAGVYGSTAAKKLQEYKDTSNIPLILISGSVEKAVLDKVLPNGKLRFLKKPFDLTKLEAVIKELLPDGGYTR